MNAHVQSSRLTRAEAVARAEALADRIRPHVDEAEKMRRMPPVVADAFKTSGLIPLMRPACFGGYEADWATFLDVLMPIGRCSGSMAWCFGFALHHQWVLSVWPEAVQKEVYEQDPDPMVVDSFAPGGRVTRVDGGYKVSGEWAFGSGGDYCDWAIVAGFDFQAEGHPKMFWFLLKPGQFTIRDVWHSLGLKASGSNNIVVEDQFVSDAYALDAFAVLGGHGPERPGIKGPIYETSPAAQFQFGLMSPLLATASALMESFIGFTADKANAYAPGKKSENPILQNKVGQSQAELDGAFAMFHRLNDQVMAGQMKDAEAPSRFNGGVGLVAKLVLDACDRLGTVSGARGLSTTQAFARHWTDVRAITNHAALQYDTQFVAVGHLMLTGRICDRLY